MNWKRFASRSISEIYSLKHYSIPARGLRILLYHSVGPRLECDRYGTSIATELFRCQMATLQHTESVNPVPLNSSLYRGSGKPQVAVTFDDGYRDNLYNAAPILADLGIPFTVFIVPGYVKNSNSYYLTASELKELASIHGCTVGSHGMNHVPLIGLPDGALIRELKDSRRWLEDMLSKPVNLLAYPHGSANQKVRDAAASFGYTVGVCSRSGINQKDRDPLMLCRTEILGCDDLRVFNQKLFGGWDWHRFRHRDPATV